MERTELTPATQAELVRLVEENVQGPKRPLWPVGGRTALRYGGGAEPHRPGITISTAELTRVLDYPARDMTITVEAGITVAALQETLAKEGQRLPIDIPQPQRATLGGALATNTSGPGRFGSGTFRDYVIGISAVDSTGRRFSAGGRVVKNVAGYDLCKLLVGSLGTLGIITQVTLKVRPTPEARRIVWAVFPELRSIAPVLDRLVTSETRPAAMEVFNSKAARHIVREARLSLPAEQPVLAVAFEGTVREAEWQAAALQGELHPFQPVAAEPLTDEPAAELWLAMTEYQSASDDPLTFQASLLPSHTIEFCDAASAQGVAVQSHAGNGIVIGHLPDRCATVESAALALRPLRELAERHGGHLTILNCDEAWLGRLSTFGPRRGDRDMMDRVRRQLDPLGLLSPGRFQ